MSIKTDTNVMLMDATKLKTSHLKKAKESRVYFAEKFLGIKTYPYQQDVLNSKSKYVVILFGRQLGKTVIGIIYILHTMNMFPGSRVGIMANNKHRAKEIYEMVSYLQTLNPILARRVTKSTQTDLIVTQELKTSDGIIYKEHSHLTFYASGGNSSQIRGVALNGLMLDEVEFTSAETLSSATPTTLATRGWIFQSSTPGLHKYSQFYRLFTTAWAHKQKWLGLKPLNNGEKKPTSPICPENRYEAFHTIYLDILDVINPVTGVPQVNLDFIQSEKFKDEDAYTREYLAKWLDGSSTFFPEDALINCQVSPDFSPAIKGEKRVVMGLDFARLHDYTAIVIAEIYPDQPLIHIVHSWMQNRVEWEEILRNVINLIKKYGVETIIYDPNGIGDVVSEWLKKSMPDSSSYTFESLSFQNSKSSNLKAELYGNLKFGLSLGKVVINRDLTTLIDQMKHMVEKRSTATKESTRLSITAPQGMKDDLVDACVLACKNQMFTYGLNMDEPTKYVDRKPVQRDLLTERINVVSNTRSDDLLDTSIISGSTNPDMVSYVDDEDISEAFYFNYF